MFGCGQQTRALCWQVLQAVASLASPVLIFFLLLWLENDSLPEWHGYLYAAGIGVASLMASTLRRAAFSETLRAGLIGRAGLCALAFARAEQLDWSSVAVRLDHGALDGDPSVTAPDDSTSSSGGDDDMSAAPLGRMSELLGRSADGVLSYFDALVVIVVLPFEVAGCVGVLFMAVSWAGLGGVIVLAIVLGLYRAAEGGIEAVAAGKAAADGDLVEVLNETLTGIMSIKLSGWLATFTARLHTLGAASARIHRSAAWVSARIDPLINIAVDYMSIAIVVLFVFAMDRDLTPARYTSYWIVLALMHGKVLEFPDKLATLQGGRAALDRFAEFLESKGEGRLTAARVNLMWETAKSGHAAAVCTYSLEAKLKPVGLTIDAASFWWPARDSHFMMLHDLGRTDLAGVQVAQLKLRPGELCVVQGDVGSGKSTLLYGLLGEVGETETTGSIGYVDEDNEPWLMPETDGNALMAPGDTPTMPRPRCAFVPQRPWLRNASIRDNIVFGGVDEAVDEARYALACWCCCLIPDFTALEDGDQTIAGDNGENLSGGQRQRVSLARAAYSTAPVVLLDDVLSALDPAVATLVFERCILGMMSGRTRVLVSHSKLVAACAEQVAVANGAQLKLTAMTPAAAKTYFDGESTTGGADVPDNIVVRGAALSLSAAGLPTAAQRVPSELELERIRSQLGLGPTGTTVHKRISSIMFPDVELERSTQVSVVRKDAGVRTVEALEQGMSTSHLEHPAEKSMAAAISVFFGQYCRGIGGWGYSLGTLATFLAEIVAVETGVWYMAKYSDETENGESPNHGFYVGIYFASILVETLAAYARQVLMLSGCQKVHNGLRSELIDRLMKADLSFFDRTSTASIIQLFSGDLASCDGLVTQTTSNAFGYGLGYGGTVCILVVIVLPWVAIAVVPLICALGMLLRQFQASHATVIGLGDRQAGIFNSFVELLSGLPTIRAAHHQVHAYRRFVDGFDVDTATVLVAKDRELRLVMFVEWIGGLLLLSVAITVAAMREAGVSSDVASFALLNVCFASAMAHLFITNKVELDDLASHRHRITAGAPSAGNDSPKGGTELRAASTDGDHGGVGITFDQVELRYMPSAAPVLSSFSVAISSGQRVGIVGRTGAGKSTLIRALCRTLPPSSGSIAIDGINLATVSEDSLRQTIGVVPQTPHLFGGSIRFNLDPTAAYNDAELWTALEVVNAKDFVLRLPAGVDTVISMGGASLSAGERQLICLARVILRGARLVLLDEATASLDDSMLTSIGEALSKVAETATVIQIAHQTSTVVGCDRILVLEAGELIEDDAPSELLKQRRSTFFGMVSTDSRALSHPRAVQEALRPGQSGTVGSMERSTLVI